MRLAALTLGAVVMTTAPVGAGWNMSGSAARVAGTTALVALAAPTVTASCVGDGTLGLVIRWNHTSSFVSGYEVWRLTDGNASKVTDTGPTATMANDIQAVGVNLRYYVVSRAGAWTRTGAIANATTPLCQPPAPQQPAGAQGGPSALSPGV